MNELSIIFFIFAKNIKVMSTKKITKETKKTEKKLSKKEIELRAKFDRLSAILKEHNVKPFNRKEFYANYQ